MKIIIDIDGTICTHTDGRYELAQPFEDRIEQMNRLYDLGHNIHYWTARGMNSGKNWQELTKKQFEEWGVKYHKLSFNKPSYDIWIDDKAMSDEGFFDDFDNWS